MASVATATPRAQWKAVIELPGGAMSVPVKLYTAVRAQGISFRMLHDQDETPVRQVMECPVENKEVPREHAVKGFEVRKDQYVRKRRGTGELRARREPDDRSAPVCRPRQARPRLLR